MGLTDYEYERIVEILGREPNYCEVGMFAVLWSEHCAYKHSRPLFKLFPTDGPQILQGPGENAGIIDIGDGQAIVMKVESHNHPSAVEPYQGAATGVGGILRDIFTMGARPIASLNSLRFGPLTNDRARYIFDGVVAGIAGYGNCVGVPTVAGEVYFEECYTDNCLVNAMSVGIVEHKNIVKASASGIGNPVMVVGASTGRDGIHGASFASVELDEKSEEKRPAVQVGDPFTEKLLIEACIELINTGLVVGIQDMGAAGLTSSSSEMASRAGSGIEMDISLVPRREEGMTPYEIMLSESQERMLVVPKKGAEEEVKKIFEKWGLNAVVVGRVTDDGMLRIMEGDKVAAEVPAKALSTDGAPVYHPESRRPEYLDELHGFDFDSLEEPADYNDAARKILSSWNIASKEWVYQQYDYQVQTNTVAVPGKADAAVLRIKGTDKAISLTIDCNGRYCYLDPYEGAKIAVAEAARNVVCTGAKPLAITDGLNFGNPEKPEIFWQFKEAVKGLADACRAFNTPVTGGNVSFYNETQGKPIYPTPVVGMLGLIEDVDRAVNMEFKNEGDMILLLGDHGSELGGSEYIKVIHGLVAGRAPKLDLDLESRLHSCCLKMIGEGIVKSAHDCSEGGLFAALAESCITGNIGASVGIEAEGIRPDAILFGESQSRIVISIDKGSFDRVKKIAEEFGIPCNILGRVGGDSLRITAGGACIDLSVEEMNDLWRRSIARMMTRE